MKVKAVKSFGGVNIMGRWHHSAGDVFELPEGADWLEAGLVIPVRQRKSKATRKPSERATGRGQD